MEDKLDQWRKVEAFFAGFTNSDGSLSGGINGYEAPHQFERDQEQHLRNHLARLIEEAGLADRPERELEPPVPPRWVDAPPYPGLEAFTPEQAPIFFGRGPEIDQLIQSLSDPRVRFLAVAGFQIQLPAKMCGNYDPSLSADSNFIRDARRCHGSSPCLRCVRTMATIEGIATMWVMVCQ